MKTKPLTFLFIIALASPLFINLNQPAKAANNTQNLYVGIDAAYESLSATKQSIDKVSAYTNTFIIGCIGNRNSTRLDILTQYVFDKGMSFIIYTDSRRYPSANWLSNATIKYGDKFLGIYFYDESGGRQLDQNYPAVTSAENYEDAAEQYNRTMSNWLRGKYSITQNFAYPTQYKLFSSDYALYWFDYKAGYDTIFAEFGWNYSRQINVAQCRGAATAFGKDWGVMITWTYRQPPYIESGENLYNDMVLAYQNGAKYIFIFDSNQEYSQSILKQEHLDAMKRFWQYVQNHPRTITPTSGRVAYVLPENYAYGFRGIYDKIWGLWGPDDKTLNICMNISSLLTIYGDNLDIIYPDTPTPIQSLGYQKILYWNNQSLPDPTVRTNEPISSIDATQGFLQSNFYLIALTITIAAVAVVAVVLKLRK